MVYRFTNNTFIICALFAVLLILSGVILSAAEPTKFDFDALINETQKDTDDPNEMTIVWWMPDEYWYASFVEEPAMPDDELKKQWQRLAGIRSSACVMAKSEHLEV